MKDPRIRHTRRPLGVLLLFVGIVMDILGLLLILHVFSTINPLNSSLTGLALGAFSLIFLFKGRDLI